MKEGNGKKGFIDHLLVPDKETMRHLGGLALMGIVIYAIGVNLID